MIGCVYKAYSNRLSFVGSLYKLTLVGKGYRDGREGNADNGIIYFVLSRYETRVALLMQLDNFRWLLIKIEAPFSGPCFNMSHGSDNAIILLSKKSDCLLQQLENGMFKFLKTF